MQCAKCGCYRAERDFYHKSDRCYKCMYKEKLRVAKGLTNTCAKCGEGIANGRKYCSEACRKESYWFTKINKSSLVSGNSFGDGLAYLDV